MNDLADLNNQLAALGLQPVVPAPAATSGAALAKRAASVDPHADGPAVIPSPVSTTTKATPDRSPRQAEAETIRLLAAILERLDAIEGIARLAAAGIEAPIGREG
jgi:hypothetical protein